MRNEIASAAFDLGVTYRYLIRLESTREYMLFAGVKSIERGGERGDRGCCGPLPGCRVLCISVVGRLLSEREMPLGAVIDTGDLRSFLRTRHVFIGVGPVARSPGHVVLS